MHRRTDYGHRERKQYREKNYYYDSYGYRHYYSNTYKNYNDPYQNRKPGDRRSDHFKDSEHLNEQRRKDAADLEKNRRKEYLKNICCLFPCCCCCYCRCQKFPKEEDVSEISDT